MEKHKPSGLEKGTARWHAPYPGDQNKSYPGGIAPIERNPGEPRGTGIVPPGKVITPFKPFES
ncbi:MAG: hypothetical protein WBQ69_05920 [Gallionella sp.]